MSTKTVIPIGPYHPLQEEPELFKLYCDGETVTDIEWETGYNHRGIEKISESKTGSLNISHHLKFTNVSFDVDKESYL